MRIVSVMRIFGFSTDFSVPPVAVRERYVCRDVQQTDFLCCDASRYNDIGACCFVSAWVDELRTELAGFVTFSPCLLTVKQQTALVSKKGEVFNIPAHMPCWLIGQLSRHAEKSEPGLGRALLFFAITEIVRRAEHGAGGLIVIDVVSKSLIPYYESCGFVPLFPQPQHWIPRNGSLRMYMTMSTASQIAALFSSIAGR